MPKTLVLVALMLIPRLLPAQGVLVAPHYLVMDHRTRSGSLTVYNPGTDPIEVSISTLFGYPVTDSAGNFSLFTPEITDSTMPSATSWVEAFPRRMTLAPKDRQTIRLLGRPPAGIKDGEYWTRLVVSAKGGQIQVSGVEDSSGIEVGLTLEVRSILPVFYRKGTVGTGIRISGIRAAMVGDSLEIRAHLERQGGAAYLGTVRGSLIDSAGKSVSTFASPIAVYYTADPVFRIPLIRPAAGRYRLRLEVATEREDLTPDIILHSAVVRDSADVRLP